MEGAVETIKINQLISVLIQAQEEAGRVIKAVHDSGDLGTIFKAIDDPTTVADFTA